MTVYDRIAAAVSRVATLARVTELRKEETARRAEHDPAIHQRLEIVADTFETLADEMEKALTT